MLLCLSGILVNKHGVPEEEENFDEAIKAVNMTLVPTRVMYMWQHCLVVVVRRNMSGILQSAKPFGCVNCWFPMFFCCVFQIPSEVSKIFSDDACINISESVSMTFLFIYHLEHI